MLRKFDYDYYYANFFIKFDCSARLNYNSIKEILSFC